MMTRTATSSSFVDGQFSKEFKVTTGVLQGGVLALGLGDRLKILAGLTNFSRLKFECADLQTRGLNSRLFTLKFIFLLDF